MTTPREKYREDILYHQIVDAMVGMIEACHLTPAEMREAAVLASIIYHERHVGPWTIPYQEIEDFLSKIEKV